MPLSNFFVSNENHSLATIEAQKQAWIPTWYREMIMAARSESSASSSASSSTTISSEIPTMASMDLGWTTATSKNASVWEGPKVWEGVDKNSMDFNSSLVAGNNWTTPAVTTHTTIVAPTVVTRAVVTPRVVTPVVVKTVKVTPVAHGHA